MTNLPSGQALPRLCTSVPGPKSQALSANLTATECPSFEARRASRQQTSGSDQSPIVYAHARGANVVDVDGNVFVDLCAGFGALALGHNPEAINEAVSKQLSLLALALGDVYASDTKVALCKKLAALFPEPGARVLLGMSGADAVTAALKSATLKSRKPGVIAFEGGYHGLSHGPLAACGFSESFRAPFQEQLNTHVRFAPYPASESELEPALAAVRHELSKNDVGAILVEPILGRGGCVVPPRDFLTELRRECDRAGALLIADEIWTGCGRSGALFYSIEQGIIPDLICIGKSLGAGFPVSACIGRGPVLEAWGAHGGTAIHTATHFGWPIGCVAALAFLNELESRNLASLANSVGAGWRANLATALTGTNSKVRGAGLIVGIELETGADALRAMRDLLNLGYIVLTGGRAGNVLTLTPPLTICREQRAAFVDALSKVVRSSKK